MYSLKYFTSLLVLILLVNQIETQANAELENILSLRMKEKKILNDLLNATKYDATVIPTSWNETLKEESNLVVTVNMFLRSISDLDEQKQQFETQITYRNQWNDPRLKFDGGKELIRYLVLNDVSRIWTPDTFFSNEKQGHFHEMLKPNQLLRIYSNGDVLYSIRISLTLACPMDFKYYPHTVQQCQIRLASYGFSTDDLAYVWKTNAPVQVSRNLHLKGYYLTSYNTSYCTSRTGTGEYSCLSVDLNFKSDANQFFWQVYLPSAALIIVSWISFWLHPKATVARVSLIGISTLLLFFVLTNFKLPPVDYTVLIQEWIAVCYIFMFGALIEFALVSSGQIAERNSGEYDIADAAEKGWKTRILSRLPGSGNKLDLASKIIFPLAFVLFVIYYCCTVNNTHQV